MRITKAQLKQLIKEELEQTLEENPVVIPEEQLDEGAMGMVMKVLQSPQAKEILKKMIMPMIQQAMANMSAPAPAAPAAPAPGAPAE